MKDNKELIIYILFLAISLLGGVWKNFKKGRARKQESEPMGQPVGEGKLEELFEPQNQAQELKSAIELENKRLEEERRALVLEAEANKSAAMIRSDSSKRRLRPNSNQESEHTIEEEISNTNLDLEDFDVKKAIIYSEILNPPYL